KEIPMPVTLGGFTRYRKHQFGRETTFGTKVAAKRAYPFSGVPAPNPNWTDIPADFGSLDPIAAPYLGTPDLPASLTAPMLAYDDLPLMMCGVFGGAATAVGATTSKTWAHTPASLTADAF